VRREKDLGGTRRVEAGRPDPHSSRKKLREGKRAVRGKRGPALLILKGKKTSLLRKKS